MADPLLQRLWSLVRQVQGNLDGKTIRSGTDTVTFTASQSSATKTITHGLPSTPTAIVMTTGTGTAGITLNYHTVTATTFGVSGFSAPGALTGTYPFSWVAFA